MTKYPSQIDTTVELPLVTDNQTGISASTVNKLRNAIIAIEAELGVAPSSTYSTVRARLDALELGHTDFVRLGTDIGGTVTNPLVIGIQGRPITTEDPLLNSVLTWNGIAWVHSEGIIGGILTVPLHGVVQTETTNSDTAVAIGTIVFDPSVFFDNDATYTVEIQATLETTDAAATAQLQLYNLDTSQTVTNSTLTSTSLTYENVRSTLTVGAGVGEIHESEQTYQIQLLRSGGDLGMSVSCRQAQIIITRTG